jgi:two-component system sensor histidine kinase BaeS
VQRLALLDPERRTVVGNPDLGGEATIRPVLVDDRIVGWIARSPYRRISPAADLAFQQEQLRAAWIIGRRGARTRRAGPRWCWHGSSCSH